MRGTDIRELLETAISRLQFFYIYSLSLTLSLYLLGNSISLKNYQQLEKLGFHENA